MKITSRIIGVISVIVFCFGCTKLPVGFSERSLVEKTAVFIESSQASQLDRDTFERHSGQFTQYLDRANPPGKTAKYYDSRLKSVSKRILPQTKKKRIDIKVYEAPRVEVYSPKNASIRLTTATMDLTTDDELAAVLAQQIALLKLGFSRRRFEVALDLMPNVNLTVSALTPRQLLALEQMFFRVCYSSEQLEQVDDLTAQLLVKNGISVAALGGALRKIAALPRSSRYAMTHQGANVRAERYGALLLNNRAARKMEVVEAVSKTSIVKTSTVKTSTVKPSAVPSSTVQSSAVKSSTLTVSPRREKTFEEPVKKESSPQISKSRERQSGLGVSASGLLGWFIQVESLKSENEARQKRESLLESGYIALVQNAKVKGVQYYRVLVGPYNSREAALKKLPAVVDLRISKAVPFVKQLK